MSVLYAATTAILVISFIAFLIEEALRSVEEKRREQQADPRLKLS